MASLIYNSFFHDILAGNINCGSDTFKCLLVTSSYTPDKAHDRRNDVTNEVSGTGYTAGGNSCTITVNAVDNTNNQQTVDFSVTSWTSSTITARGAVIYKSRGGTSSSDELVCYLDLGADQSTSSGTFSLSFSSAPLILQN